MFKNGRKWLEMAENDSKLMERLEMAVNGFKQLDITKKTLEMAGMAVKMMNTIKMMIMKMKNQKECP